VRDSEIKRLLQSYRLATWTRTIHFPRSLERVASDPQLAEWFRQEQEFDAVMIEKFREVPVDDAARQRVLRAIESVKWPDRADDETP
jgi:hypothetical protein